MAAPDRWRRLLGDPDGRGRIRSGACVVGGGCACERRAPARIGIGEQGELRYYQQLAADRVEGAIHLAGNIGEHANPEDSIGEPGGIGFGIALRNSEQNHETAPYFP